MRDDRPVRVELRPHLVAAPLWWRLVRNGLASVGDEAEELVGVTLGVAEKRSTQPRFGSVASEHRIPVTAHAFHGPKLHAVRLNGLEQMAVVQPTPKFP